MSKSRRKQNDPPQVKNAVIHAAAKVENHPRLLVKLTPKSSMRSLLLNQNFLIGQRTILLNKFHILIMKQIQVTPLRKRKLTGSQRGKVYHLSDLFTILLGRNIFLGLSWGEF